MSVTTVSSEERVAHTLCTFHCMTDGCVAKVTVRDGRAVHLEKHPQMKYPPCAKMWTNLGRLYHPDRILYPMKRVGERGEGKWERISWDEALETVASRLNEIKARYGNESVLVYYYAPHLALPSGFLGIRPTVLRLFSLWGGCIPSYERGSLCWQAYISASNYLYGTYKVAAPPDEECELILIWSSNLALGGARGQLQSFLEAKQKGTKFYVVDPIFTDTAAVLADELIAPLPGTDLALTLALMHVIVAAGLHQEEAIRERTNAPFLVREDNGMLIKEGDLSASRGQGAALGQEAYEAEGTFRRAGRAEEAYLVWDLRTNRPQPHNAPGIQPALTGSYPVGGIACRPVWQRLVDHLKPCTPRWAQEICGVPTETIERVALELGRARPGKVYFMTGGFQRTTWGENATYALGMLNALIGSVLGSVSQWEPRLPSLDLGILETAKRLCVENPVRQRVPISCLAEAVLNPEAYGTDIRALYIFQGNPVAQHPNTNKTIQALKSERMEFIVVTDIFMSETAKYADILLPASTLLERAMIWEGSEVGFCYHPLLAHRGPKRYLAYAERAVEPLGESKDDFEIACELAKKWGLEEHFPWRNAEEWVEDILDMAREDPRFPWLQEVTMERLIQEGVVEVAAPAQEVSPEFATPSGRIELYNETLLQLGYDPMPVWRELAESRAGSPELHARYPLHFMTVHYKLSVNSSYANQPEILELGENDLLMHPIDAGKRGIADGDEVVAFNDRGSLTVRARVAEEIRPGVVRMGQAGWEKWGNTSLLTSDRLTAGYGENPTNNTCLVEVKKAQSL